MKSSVLLLVGLFAVAGCGGPGGQTPNSLSPSATEATPVTSPSETPTPSPTPTPVASAPAANVVCNKLSFYLPPALGKGFTCKTVPEASGVDLPYFSVNPKFTQVTIGNYPLSGTFHEARVELYPVERFTQLATDPVSERVNGLKALVAGGPLSGGELPFLPIWNAKQLMSAQLKVISTAGSQGVRFLTEYAQFLAPINNTDLFFTYQGITPDGHYWVSVVLPINHPDLPTNADNPPAGQTWEQFGEGYETYVAGVVTQLDSKAAGSFTPGLGDFDLLVSSIKVQP